MTAILCLIVGLLVFGAGLYYLSQSKDNAESRKIYGVTTAVGAVVAVISAVMILL